MTIQTTKHSFADMLASKQAAKHNSDLANLAEAVTQIDAEIVELGKIRAEILETAALIEAGNFVDVAVIKRLYGAARVGRVTL